MTKRKIILIFSVVFLLVLLGTFLWNRYTPHVIYEYNPHVIVDGTHYRYQNTYNYYQVEDIVGDYIGIADGQLKNPRDFEKMKHLSSTVKGDVYKMKNAEDMKWICLVPEYDKNYVILCGSSDETYLLERELPEVAYDYHEVAFWPGDNDVKGIISSKQELSNVIKEFHVSESYFDKDKYHDDYFKNNCLVYGSFSNEDANACYLRKMEISNHILRLYVYKDNRVDHDATLQDGNYSGVFVDVDKEVLKEVSEVSVVVESVKVGTKT